MIKKSAFIVGEIKESIVIHREKSSPQAIA